SVVVRLTTLASLSMAVVWIAAISCWLRVLRTMSRPLESGAYRKLRSPSPARLGRITAISDFSGLTSSPWALASALARAATESLDRGMGDLCGDSQNIEAHGAGLRALGAHAMPDALLGILGHERLQLALGPFV